MFCNNCGKELPDDSKFCTMCGAKINFGYSQAQSGSVESNQTSNSQEVSTINQINEANTSSNTPDSQNQESTTTNAQGTNYQGNGNFSQENFQNSYNQNTYNQNFSGNQNQQSYQSQLLQRADSVNTWMITSMVFQVLNFIPYLNSLSCIPGIIIAIISMCKAKNFFQDVNETEFAKKVSLVRLLYILFFIGTFIGIIIFVFAVIVVSAAAKNNGGSEDTMSLMLGFGVIIGILWFIASVAYQIWALVVWIQTNSKINEIKARIMASMQGR